MKKSFVFLFALAALLLLAGGRRAEAMTAEPYVTWDPQSVAYPVGADAEYAATFSGSGLAFTWYVDFGGKDYELPAKKSELMSAGMKSYCDDVVIQSSSNRTSIVFKNVKLGIDGSSGKWTRVYCHAFDGNTGADTSSAHVSCVNYGLSDAGMPPMIYVRPVVNLSPDSAGKIGVKLIGGDSDRIVDMAYQWFNYKGGPYDVGLSAIPGEDGSVCISAAEPGKSEDLVVGIDLKLKGGGDYWIYSSPINVNRLSGEIDYSQDQLRIVKTPDRSSYTLGDKLDMTGLEAEYIAGGKSQGIVPISSLETDITEFTYAGPVWVTVGYKGETNGFTVWVDPEAGDWELEVAETVPASTEAPTAAPTAEPTTEVPPEAPTTAEVPTQPETTEAADTQPDTTAAPETAEPAQPESTAAPSTEAPATAAPSTAAPVQTTEAAPNGSGGGGNTVLIILIIIMAMIIGLLSGILMSKKKQK